MKTFISSHALRRFTATFVVVLLLSVPAALYPKPSADETVMFNTQTHKVHKPNCTWAIKCTKNCIPLKRSEAYKRGGVPCKVCGGGEGSGVRIANGRRRTWRLSEEA